MDKIKSSLNHKKTQYENTNIPRPTRFLLFVFNLTFFYPSETKKHRVIFVQRFLGTIFYLYSLKNKNLYYLIHQKTHLSRYLNNDNTVELIK